MSTHPLSKLRVLSFNGTNNYVEVPYQTQLNPEQFTLSCWAKVTGKQNQWRSPLTCRTDESLGGYILYAGENNKWQFWTGNGNTWAGITGPDIVLETWTHLAATYDGTQMKFYVNAEPVGTAVASKINLNKRFPLRIGAGKTEGNPDYFFAGQIAEVQVWNRVRSQEEIKKSMNYRLVGDEAGLVGYWPLNEGSGTIATDKTSSGKNGQIHGATWQQSLIPLSATAPSINANAQEIQDCRRTIEELRNYQQRYWGIGLNEGTFEPDGFLTFFASRKLPFKFFVRGGGVSLGQPSAYDQNIATLENYIQTLQSQKLNIVIFITDQESAAVAERWEPPMREKSFEEEHLPAMKRLKKNGITFNKMFTVSAACSPSRASLLTSTYPQQHGVWNTLAEPFGIESRYNDYGKGYIQRILPPNQVNLAHVLKAAGYKVFWKGKWHLSPPIGGTDEWTDKDIEYMKQSYGFDGWEPRDAGIARQDVTKFAKGTFYNDERYLRGIEGVKKVIEEDAAQGRYVFSGLSPEEREDKKQQLLQEIEAGNPQKEEGILEFIQNYNPEDGPFCLVVSLVNPHDIHVAPSFEKDAGYAIEDFENFDLPIPDNAKEDLSHKPEIQEIFKQGCKVSEENRVKRLKRQKQLWTDAKDIGDPFLTKKTVQQMFVNFYGYLRKLVDHQINEVIDALEAKGLIDNTLLVRTSDHGEMCLNHGQREKAFNAYEETIRVPLIISNPRLFPNAIHTDALACSIDIVPTLAKFVGVYDMFKFAFQGQDLTPLFTNPQQKVRDAVHFTYDDGFLPDRFQMTPLRIRTIRTDKWKYSVYFDNQVIKYEYELYDLENDPLENDNLAGQEEHLETLKTLHLQLQEMMFELKTVPLSVSIYTEKMMKEGFLPPLCWPTPEEAECSASMQCVANEAQAKFRKKLIITQALTIPAEMWWVGS
jgi:arylsulfatase A-like enzyme